MDIEIKELRKKDFSLARKFAIDGMHLTWYTNNQIELYLYSQYFWCLEISRATNAIGAYINDELVGVLLADIHAKPKLFPLIWHKLFIMLGATIIKLAYKSASDLYGETNVEMLRSFKEKHKPDGELNFFAVDPKITGLGIGTLLLNKLENVEKGKLIYLYTDSGSTYQFYTRRGFRESSKAEIKLKINKKEVPLTCFLFSKTL